MMTPTATPCARQTKGAIAGAAISLTSDDGTYSQTLTSVINPDATAYQGMCFANVPPGKYSVSVAAPDGYNPTMNLTSSLDVNPGDLISVNFGAQPKAADSGSNHAEQRPFAAAGRDRRGAPAGRDRDGGVYLENAQEEIIQLCPIPYPPLRENKLWLLAGRLAARQQSNLTW